ncbi:MAG: zeta toxin family protein [Deltaproteobacteria bacterium]|jgi:hypothetical protein|nr:zeta toxin family protein [Deltaproteobacteria bacterium]
MSEYQHLSSAEIELFSGDRFLSHQAETARLKQPALTIVGAQPEAGERNVADMARLELKTKGGRVHMDADGMRNLIPIGDSHPASEETRADALKLAKAMRNPAVEARFNIIEEGTFRIPEILAKLAKSAHEPDYIPELVVVSAHPEESLQGVRLRCEKQILAAESTPRLVNEDRRDSAMAGFTDDISTKNPYADPYEALLEGRKPIAERIHKIVDGWNEVEKMAQKRSASDSYLGKILKRGKRVAKILETIGKSAFRLPSDAMIPVRVFIFRLVALGDYY